MLIMILSWTKLQVCGTHYRCTVTVHILFILLENISSSERK